MSEEVRHPLWPQGRARPRESTTILIPPDIGMGPRDPVFAGPVDERIYFIIEITSNFCDYL